MALTVDDLISKGAVYAETVLQSAPTGEEGDFNTRDTALDTVLESYRDRDDAVSTILVSDSGDAPDIIRAILSNLAFGKIVWEDGETNDRIPPTNLATHIQEANAAPDNEWEGLEINAPFVWFYYETDAFLPGHTARELVDLRDDAVLYVVFKPGVSATRMTDEGLEVSCDVRISTRWVLEDRETEAPEDFCKSMQDVLGNFQGDWYSAVLTVDLSSGNVRHFTLDG